ncbi:hypothetical protein DdX_05005 [Ditylenchus destructor]|uniref:Uncharacterized protein n=1 Tax=Ditylenchus destructor TaxID=166010 RepID=A0AAD4R798_9BILA|nr:hypothetical protein DdX_05005 [Ditylenchus destructor]
MTKSDATAGNNSPNQRCGWPKSLKRNSLRKTINGTIRHMKTMLVFVWEAKTGCFGVVDGAFPCKFAPLANSECEVGKNKGFAAFS